MYGFFPQGVSVITVVVLDKDNKPKQKFRLAKSAFDMPKRFALRPDGEPVLGPKVFRERTKKELEADGLKDAPYLDTLVSICNVQVPEQVAVA